MKASASVSSQEWGGKLREFYRTSRDYARHLADENEGYFDRYLALIERYGSRATALLDAGCGTGLSSCLLSRGPRKVVGMDLSELFLREGKRREGGKSQNLLLTAGDILHLPFRDGSFDLVGSYLVIEFLPDVEKGLEEMVRVLRRGGTLLVVAPNLLSVVWPLRDFFRMIIGGPPRPVWCESPGAALRTFWRNLSASLGKIFRSDAEFLYRKPDLSCDRVVGQDSDSVYLACPTDLVRFLEERGFRILRTSSSNFFFDRWVPAFSRGVELVARKD